MIYTKQELLELATKKLTVNKEVAKLADNKTMTRRLKTNLKEGDVFWLREPARVSRFDDIISQIDFEYSSDNRKVYQFNIPKRFEVKNRYEVKAWLKNCQSVPNGCIKEMARHFYEVISVREELLQDINEEDCLKEGITKDLYPTEDGEAFMFFMEGSIATYYDAKSCFEDLWNSTAKAPNRWQDNPSVEVVEYIELEYTKC